MNYVVILDMSRIFSSNNLSNIKINFKNREVAVLASPLVSHKIQLLTQIMFQQVPQVLPML